MRRWICTLVLASFLCAGGATAQLFEDVTWELGLGVNSSSLQGMGCAFADVDGDGNLDIMVVDGQGDPNQLFMQEALRTFLEVGSEFGVADTAWGKSVVFADIDNDGDKDLLHTVFQSSNRLYRNDGDVFTDISEGSGLDFISQSSGAAWADYDNDGLLDVYITTYGSAPNLLMKNLGDGTFLDVTDASGAGNIGGVSFQPVWLDYDGDNDMDIYVANDIFNGANALFRNEGDGTFTDVSESSGAGVHISAMGLAVGDHDNDLDLDIYITNTAEGNVFLLNNGDGTFTDVAAENGTIANVVGWGTNFFDFNHDGYLDIYLAVYLMDFIGPGGGDEVVAPRGSRGGYLLSPGGLARLGAMGGQDEFPNFLFENLGDGTFTNVSEGSGADHKGRSFGTATGDYDGDGDLDIYVTNLFKQEGDSSGALIENHHVPRGDPGDGDWLKVRLEGTTSNRDGVGARVWLRTTAGLWQMREREAGTSYLSCSDPDLHFGLGGSLMVDSLFVRWPSGLLEFYENTAGGQLVTLVEGEGTTVSAPPHPAEGAGTTARLLGVAPNPVRRGAEIRLRLEAGAAVVSVFSIEGRLVRTLRVDGAAEGRETVLSWDGRDARGRRLAAGPYFLTLGESFRSRQATKVLVLGH